jgi:pyruvate/2-oxoglutarate dehydrogenase complex dihydrolipoamide acyltransferase (E2) component
MIRAETAMAATPEKLDLPPPAAPLLIQSRWRNFWRLCCWGSAAAAAITAVVMIGQTRNGAERLHLGLAQTQPEQPQAIAVLPPRVLVDEVATKRLADAVRALTADRDRLNARLAGLERNFDDMTGSIKSVMRANAAVESAKQAPPAKPPALPALGPVASAPPPAPPVTASAPEPAAPPPLQPTAQQPQENVPLPPVRVASAPNVEPGAEAPAPIPQYGIDLGVAVSIEALRGEWARVKANYGPLLGGLRPVAAPRQRTSGVTDYRLVIGPFPTVAAASRMCAKLSAARVPCRAAKFAGEDVALQ